MAGTPTVFPQSSGGGSSNTPTVFPHSSSGAFNTPTVFPVSGSSQQPKLGWGDIPGSLWGGLKQSATGVVPLAVQLFTTPDEFVADFRKSSEEIAKTFSLIPRSWGNAIIGDEEDAKKFNEAFRQKFFADPLTYSVVGLALGKGVGARVAALRALEKGKYRTVTAGVESAPPPPITPWALTRAGVLGWDPALPEGYKRGVISVKLHKPLEGVGIEGTELVTRTLPRSTLRAERMLAVDAALKNLVPPHWWLLGEHSRAARTVRKTGRVPYLALMSLPVFAEADKVHRDMSRLEQTAEGLRNALPAPRDFVTHLKNMRTLGTPGALATVAQMSDPKIRELYMHPTERMQHYNELAHELAAEREKILIRAGAATPVPQPTHVPVSLLKKFRVYDIAPYSHKELQAEIEKGGITEPIELGVDPEGRAAILDGNHRLAIAERMGLTEVPFMIKPVDQLGKTKVPLAAGDLKPLGLDGSVGKVPEFEASPYRQTRLTRGGRILTNSLANKFLRKTDADIAAAGRKGRRLVNEAERFGTTDLREITKQTRLASEDLMRESLRRGRIYERAQQGEAGLKDLSGVAEGSPITSIEDISRLVDPAYERMQETSQLFDRVLRGEIDTNMLQNLNLVPVGGKLEDELARAAAGDTLTGLSSGQQAMAQAVWDALHKRERGEERRLLDMLKRARNRTLTTAELNAMGLTIPSDIRVPTEAELTKATQLRADMEAIKGRLKEAKRFRLTPVETTRMAKTIDDLNRQILKLENPRTITRTPGTLKKRMDSRYRQAEKIIRKDLATQRESIRQLGEGLPVEKSPAEQLRHAAMRALESKFRRDVDQYERLWAAEHELRDSAEKQSQILERIAGIKRDRGALRERKITYIAGQRMRARDLIEHRKDLIALRDEIDASRGKLVGGGSPEEIALELKRMGRQLPYYRPDVMAAEKKRFGRRALAEGTITPQRPGADIYPSRSILFRTGQLAFHPDTLGPAYFEAAKHDLNVSMHKLAMSMATKIPRGATLPKGYEFLRRTRGEKISITQQLGGEHMRAIAHEFDLEHDLTTKDSEDANINFDEADGKQYRLIVPTAFANEFRAEGRKANTFTRNFIQRPMDVWRTLLLHLRVPWLVNNILSNSFLYAIRFAGAGGLASVLRFYAEDARTEGYIPAMKRLASYTLSPEEQRALHAEQIRGTRFETSATGETPDWVRNLVPTGTKQFLDQNRRARKAVALVQGVPTWLPRVDKRYERYLRRKATVRVLRGSPEVQQAYKEIRAQGSGTFKDAVDKAYAGDENLRDYVMTEVNQGLGDFLSLSRTERQYIRSLVPFYAWMREISRISAHMVVDHPLRVVILQQMAQAASEIQPEEIPEYMRGAVLLEKAGWIGALAKAIPGLGGEGGTAALALHGANPYSTVTDLARGGRSLFPFVGGNQYDRREFVGNFHPFINAALDVYAKPPTATSYGVPADLAEEFGRSIPQVQALFPYPSALYPDRNRADLIRKIFGDPRVSYDPNEAQWQLESGR